MYYLQKAATILAIIGSVLVLAACSDGESPAVVNNIWPPNAVTLSADQNAQWLASWNSQPRLEITFDREMNEESLRSSYNWLRVWRVLNYGDNEILIEPVERAYRGITDTPILGDEGVTVVYDITTPPLDPRPDESPGYLVQMQGDNIADIGRPPLSLNADFRGTELSATTLDVIWNLPGDGQFDDEIWDGLLDTGQQLPSGDDREGGHFHGWFAVDSG